MLDRNQALLDRKYGRPALLQLSFRSDLLSAMSEHDLSKIVGGQLLSVKRSAVNELGMLRQSPIADVILRPTRPVHTKMVT